MTDKQTSNPAQTKTVQVTNANTGAVQALRQEAAAVQQANPTGGVSSAQRLTAAQLNADRQALTTEQVAARPDSERVPQQAERVQDSPADTAAQTRSLQTDKPANADLRGTPAGQEPAAVLRTGEVANSTVAGLSGGKTYYHRIPGARTTMPDGLEIVFAGGMFATSDPDIIRELDKVANKSASQIFTKREALNTVRATEQRLAQEAADTVGNNKNL